MAKKNFKPSKKSEGLLRHKQTNRLAVFDIKPTNQNGSFKVVPKLNLRKGKGNEFPKSKRDTIIHSPEALPRPTSPLATCPPKPSALADSRRESKAGGPRPSIVWGEGLKTDAVIPRVSLISLLKDLPPKRRRTKRKKEIRTVFSGLSIESVKKSTKNRKKFKKLLIEKSKHIDFNNAIKDFDILKLEEEIKALGGYIPQITKCAGWQKAIPKGAKGLKFGYLSEKGEKFLSPAARDLDYVLSNFNPLHSKDVSGADEERNLEAVDLPVIAPSKSDSLFVDRNKVKRFSIDIPSLYYSLIERLRVVKGFATKDLARWGLLLLVLTLFSFGALFYFKNKLGVKNNVVQKGTEGYKNLIIAKDAFADFNFEEARKQFAFAASNFNIAKNDLDGLSSSVLGLADIFSGRLGSAEKLNEAAELLSLTGEDLSETLSKLNNINFFTFLSEEPEQNSIEYLESLKSSLLSADGNILKAYRLLLDVNVEVLPEDKRETFSEFMNRIPQLRDFIEETANYTEILMKVLGKEGRMRYVVLFQNTSELRATGGFPGTYAVIEFENGKMEKFFVNDIYNADGHLKENIIPPKPLQKITPGWGMRDANWWPDFRQSAEKISEFYYKIEKQKVDGVIALNSDFILNLLGVVDPVELKSYNLVLTEKNFLSSIQNEVEYGANREQPKTILYEFTPLFLEKLRSVEKNKWMDIFELLQESVEDKNLLAYFKEPEIQKFAFENGFAGEVKSHIGDYLMVVYSNIMGSKTDFVIDNLIDLNLNKNIQDDSIVHELKISRTHNGGDKKYGFYNKRNPSYVRVYVPLGVDFVSIKGNDGLKVNPLINYYNSSFRPDPDIRFIEENTNHNQSLNLDIFEDAGKTVFGFWLITEPKQKKTVTLKYKVPLGLNDEKINLYIQKQPGAKTDVNVMYENKGILNEVLDKDISVEFDL